MFDHYESWGHTVVALLAGVAVFALTIAYAKAQPYIPPAATPNKGALPPIEYDHPYGGKLKVIRGDRFLMGKLCPKTTMPVTLGCAYRSNDGDECVVILAEDGLIYDAGWSPEIVWRHERGHCNNWAVDHAGARPVTNETMGRK